MKLKDSYFVCCPFFVEYIENRTVDCLSSINRKSIYFKVRMRACDDYSVLCANIYPSCVKIKRVGRLMVLTFCLTTL